MTFCLNADTIFHKRGIFVDFLRSYEREVVTLLEELYSQAKAVEEFVEESAEQRTAELHRKTGELRDKMKAVGRRDEFLDALGNAEKMNALFAEFGIK